MIKDKGGFLVILVKTGVLAALLTPIVFDLDLYFPFVSSKGLWFMACAQPAFFSWLVLARHCPRYRPNFKNPVIAAALAYLGILSLSAGLGANFSVSFWSTFERMGGVLMFFHLTGFMIAAVCVLETRDWRNVFFASITLAAAVGLRALFDQSAAARGGGFLGNDSFLGTYLLFNIFIALYLFWSEKNASGVRAAKIAGIIFIALAFCLLLQGTRLWAGVIAGGFALPEAGLIKDIFNSGARAAKISFLGGTAMAGIFWLAAHQRRIFKIAGRLLAAAGAAAIFSFLFFAINPGSMIYERMVKEFGEGTVRGRLVVWEIGWRGFLERPILGWGPENFGLVFARHYNPCVSSPECSGEAWFDRAHNIIVDTLVETGAAGLIAYLGLFGAAIFALWKNYRQDRGELAAAAVFSSLFLAYFVQNLTVFDMPASYMMLFLCLGFAAHKFDSTTEKQKVFSRPADARIMAAAIIAVVICFAGFVLMPLSASEKAILASKETFFSENKLPLYQGALENSPLGINQIRLFFARQWMKVAEDKELIEKIKSGAIPAEEVNRYFEFFAQELTKSAAGSEFDFAARLELGRLYRQWSVFDRQKIPAAIEMLESARSLSPRNQQPYWELAQIKLYQRDIDAAEELARQAHDLYPNNAKSRRVLEEIQKLREQIASNEK